MLAPGTPADLLIAPAQHLSQQQCTGETVGIRAPLRFHLTIAIARQRGGHLRRLRQSGRVHFLDIDQLQRQLTRLCIRSQVRNEDVPAGQIAVRQAVFFHVDQHFRQGPRPFQALLGTHRGLLQHDLHPGGTCDPGHQHRVAQIGILAQQVPVGAGSQHISLADAQSRPIRQRIEESVGPCQRRRAIVRLEDLQCGAHLLTIRRHRDQLIYDGLPSNYRIGAPRRRRMFGYTVDSTSDCQHIVDARLKSHVNSSNLSGQAFRSEYSSRVHSPVFYHTPDFDTNRSDSEVFPGLQTLDRTVGGWPSLHSRIRDKGTSWLPDPRTSGIGDFVAGRAVGNHNGCPTIAAGDLAANRRRALTPGTRCDILRMRMSRRQCTPHRDGQPGGVAAVCFSPLRCI